MVRFLFYILAATTIFIVGINFVVGFLRRLFGFGPRTRVAEEQAKPKTQNVLYSKDGTTVYRGDASENKTHSS